MHQPPHNIELEQQIIGLLIKDPTHSNSRELMDSLSVSDFYNRSHRFIYETIKRMAEGKKDITLHLVEIEIDKLDVDYGGFSYLAEIMRSAVSISAMPSYAKVIKKCARLRDLSAALMEANDLISRNLDCSEIIEQLDNNLKDISVSSGGKELRHIREVEGDFLDELDKRAAQGGAICGLSTGIDELDEKLNGIGDDYLVVIASSPSMGKTLFCQTVATHNAVDLGKNIMFFSMEMSERSLFERFVSGVGNVSPLALKSARFTPETNGRISDAVHLLRRSGIYITDEPKQSVGQIRAKVRRHKINHPDLKAIFIDYLGLMKLGKADRHDIAIGNITRDLKELAKEVSVPVFLVVQSKRPENIKARPNMASLKDSSCIEADADVVLFVHRQEILEPETELKGITELIVAKDRHNDGNGTVYMEKINGSFKGCSAEAVGAIQMKAQEVKTKPRGYNQ
jgi:replicative DNA helicase